MRIDLTTQKASMMNGLSIGNLQTTQKKSHHVRTLFEYDPLKDSGIPGKGLSFKYGDIMYVMNASDDDWWQAQKLVGDVVDQGVGIIPSKARIEKKERSRMRSVKFQGNHTESSATLAREKKKLSFFTRKLNFNRSKHKSKSESTLIETKPSKPQLSDDVNILSYEPVTRLDLNYTRPIIILGALKDKICDELINERADLFETCVPHTTREAKEDEVDGRDYHFVTNKQSMQREVQTGLFVEAGEYNGNLYGTSLQSVKEVASRGKHCLLDVSGNAILKLQHAGIHPVSIFTKPRTIDTIYEWNKRISAEQARVAFERSARQEQEFYQYFTAIILIDSPDETLSKVKQVISEQSRNSYAWVPSKESL